MLSAETMNYYVGSYLKNKKYVPTHVYLNWVVFFPELFESRELHGYFSGNTSCYSYLLIFVDEYEARDLLKQMFSVNPKER